MKGFGDILLASALGSSEVAIKNRHFLFGNARIELFRDENYIIYSLLYNFKDRNITIDEEFVKLSLMRQQSLIEDASNARKIDINAYGEVDDSVTLGYIGGVMKYFSNLMKDEKVAPDEFRLVFEKYLIEYKAIETAKIYSDSLQIIGDGLKIGRKVLQGFEASRDYVKNNLARIEGVVDQNKGIGFINMAEVILNPKQEAKSVKISDFGALEELNNHYGGIYTGNLYTVMAPSKSGKSKFCARLAHTAMVNYGVNVSVWAFEGGYEAWTAQMRSIHFDFTYNTGVSATDVKIGVTQGAILHDRFPDGSPYKKLEATSKLDLASNSAYGSTHFIDRPFRVETFLDEIDASVKANNSQMLIIDYLQLIDSEKSMSERERIATAYPRLLEYCKKNNIAVVSPAQYKQDVVDELQRKKDGEARDMRTAGGGSYEIIKTSDVIFALWASTEDLSNNKMTIMPMPTRFYDAIPEFDIYVDLGYCQFMSLN
jgi:replicative DNA helicase